jgi:hypothetical protein
MSVISITSNYDGAAPAPIYNYSQTILQDNPVAYWPLDEASGTVAYDRSGNGWNGTYTGGFILGKQGIHTSGGAAYFDGSSGCVAISASPLTEIATITLEGWLNLTGWTTTTAGHGSLIKCGGAGNVNTASGYGVGLGNNTQWDYAGNYLEGLYEVKSWNPLSTATQVNITGWHHIVMTIESNSTSSYYMDGALVGTNSNSAIVAPSPVTYIAADGSVNGTRFLLGDICNIALYNTRLTATQIQHHYNVGSGTT